MFLILTFQKTQVAEDAHVVGSRLGPQRLKAPQADFELFVGTVSTPLFHDLSLFLQFIFSKHVNNVGQSRDIKKKTQKRTNINSKRFFFFSNASLLMHPCPASWPRSCGSRSS